VSSQKKRQSPQRFKTGNPIITSFSGKQQELVQEAEVYRLEVVSVSSTISAAEFGLSNWVVIVCVLSCSGENAAEFAQVSVGILS